MAELVAHWMLIGFIHGVLNTDNTSIAGETIDYGPCAFMDAYDPDKVFSSIDNYGPLRVLKPAGRHQMELGAFRGNAPPAHGPDTEKAAAEMTASLACFDERYLLAYEAGMRRKLGLTSEREGDLTLAQDLLSRMAQNQADFTLTFRALCDALQMRRQRWRSTAYSPIPHPTTSGLDAGGRGLRWKRARRRRRT